MQRSIRHTNSSCKIEVFHFLNSDTEVAEFSPDDIELHNTLMEVERFTIVNAVSMCTINKSIEQPRGTFDFLLLPTNNWKKKIRPGDWVVIYLGIDGQEIPRMLGNVDRVSKMIQVDDTGKKQTAYKVSGSNFGKVFEKYNIYWNPFVPEQLTANAVIQDEELKFIGGPTTIVKNLLSVFLGSGSTDNSKQYPTLLQWFIPNELSNFFQASNTISDIGPKFFDILRQDLSLVEGYKVWDNIYAVTGTLWNMLSRSANTMINELFVELKLQDGVYRPTLTMRMIPFASQDYEFKKGINAENATRFKDLDSVTVDLTDIFQEDLGENDHTRFNFFLLVSQAPQLNLRQITEALPTGIGTKFPYLLKGSMRRNGMQVKQDTTEFAFISEINQTDKTKTDSIELLTAWNDLILHWYKEDHLYETGTITMVGNPNVELGKRLVITDKTYGEKDRAYYIEGYTDSWSYPGRWDTSLQLTRGQDAETETPLLANEDERSTGTSVSDIRNGFFKSNKKGPY